MNNAVTGITATWLGHLVEPFTDPSVAVVTGETNRCKAPVGSRIEEEPARTLSNKDAKWFEIATFGGLGIGAAIVAQICVQGWKVLMNVWAGALRFGAGEGNSMRSHA